MNELLKGFYKEIHKHIQDRNYYPSWFMSNVGLCLNLTHFLNYKKVDLDTELYTKGLLKRQFVDAGLSRDTPFNLSRMEFQYEENKYENKYRIEWVSNHVKNI